MRALSVQQPWAWAIAEGHKLVENRTWKPADDSAKPGERIAIHASAKEDGDFDRLYRDLLDVHGGPLPPGIVVPTRGELAFGAVVATAKLRSFVAVPDKLEEAQRAWFSGPWGWVLEDVRRLSIPFPVKGALGLWHLSADATAEVLGRQAERARGAA